MKIGSILIIITIFKKNNNMKIRGVSASVLIQKLTDIVKHDKTISCSVKILIKLLIEILIICINKLALNSTNSHQPPSFDPNRKKQSKKKSDNPCGGQKGHVGSTLVPVPEPNEVQYLSIDRVTLPSNEIYTPNGYTARQKIDIKISTKVIEYRAETVIDSRGKKYTAAFPKGLTQPIQYGASVKVKAVYSSVHQLIPYERLSEQFKDSYKLPISKGTINNFKADTSALLVKLDFDNTVKQHLSTATLGHVDETSINIKGKKVWLHNFSNEQWTWQEPHIKRGSEAMDDIGILPMFSGIICHDHWKAYFKYNCEHALCNAHHLRELLYAHEKEKQAWAEKMGDFLRKINKEVDETKNRALSKENVKLHRESYRKILLDGNKECPAIEPKVGTKRRPKQSKSRNLLDRLRVYENQVLLFMENPLVPFTNNLGERDIRMTKVQQKISGCFRSMEGAIIHCRIKSYLSSCKKNGMAPYDALTLLLEHHKLPDFLSKK